MGFVNIGESAPYIEETAAGPNGILQQQLWGYNIEEQLRLGVQEDSFEYQRSR
jgi:hypothetical protein